VQEVAVAKNVTIQCGPYTIPWEHWDLVIEANLQAVINPGVANHIFSWMPPFSTSNTDIKEAISWDAACAIQTARRRVQKSERDHGLAPLLIRFRSFECEDARDKIYGLFQLSQQSSGIEPNYLKPPAQIYMEATQESIKHSRDLALFSMLEYSKRDLKQIVLPTWCPNYFDGQAPRGDPFYRPGYNSANGLEAEFTVENGVMTLTGFDIGTIESLLTTDAFLSDEEKNRCSNTIRTLSVSESEVAWIRQQQILHTTPSSELRDPLLGLSDKPEVIYSHDTSYLTERIYVENYLQKILKEKRTALDYAHLDPPESVKESCKKSGRQLFRSSKGSFGLAPLSARIGDYLVVFLGGKVPFCIRLVNGQYGTKSAEYHLIGDWQVIPFSHP
jgi:hypothetical protein